MTPDTSWMASAEYRNAPDARIFFPAPNDNHEPAFVYCRRCPVRDECLDHALTQTCLGYGVYGGMGINERKREARRRAARRRMQEEMCA